MSYTPSTIFVTFAAGEETVNEILDEHDLMGNLVSSLVRRWAVEVPYGKEEHFINLFSNHDYVTEINSNVLKGHERRPRPKKRFSEEKRKNW